MSGQTDKKEHEVCLNARREMRLSGVIDVDSFDEGSAVLQTTEGELSVEGEELKIGILDTERGIVTINGKINALFYSSDKSEEKRGLISRIFK